MGTTLGGIGDPEPSEGDYFDNLAHNGTTDNPSASSSDPSGTVPYLNGAGITTTEWLSFFLMTIGAFPLHLCDYAMQLIN